MVVAEHLPSERMINRNSIASFCLAIVSCTIPVVLVFPAAIFALLGLVPILGWHAAQLIAAAASVIAGILGLKDIRRSQGRTRGQGWAWTGIGISLAATFLIMPAALLGRVLPLVFETRNRTQSMQNLQKTALAMMQYHDDYARFPPTVVSTRDGKPLHSWRVMLLPYLGQKKLFDQFKLDEPWDSPANKPLLALMPPVYTPPGKGYPPPDYATNYLVFDGPRAIFYRGQPPKWLDDPLYRSSAQSYQLYPQRPGENVVYDFGNRARIASITDGTSNTILLVEADDSVPWTKPQDLDYAADKPLPKLGGHYRGDFVVAMADGSVLIVRKNASEKMIRAAITANGGEIMEENWNEPTK